MSDRKVSRPPLGLLGVFVLAALAAYQPAWHGTPVWDDDAHLTRLELGSSGGLVRTWTELGATQQYYPVTHSAFWTMNALWGHRTPGYHLVNITLHAISAWLVVWLLARIGAGAAVLGGALFLLHPVHVESVAWISELKNVLSGVLYFGAAIAYLAFDTSRRRSAYVAALALFVLALLAKTVTATLPAAILVVIWWRRGRVTVADVRPLLPFFALAIPAGLLTSYVERTFIGAAGADFTLGWLERVLVAGRAAWFYLSSLAWPVNLSFVYPKWTIDPSAVWQWRFPLALAAALALAFALRHRTRAPLAALLLFLGTLFPALGFFDVYPFRYAYVADHFQYLASVPMLALAAAGAGVLLDRRGGRTAVVVATVALSAALGLLTWRSSARFSDIDTLYTATLRTNPDAWLVYNNLAEIELQRPSPDVARAIGWLERSLAIEPRNAEARLNVGVAYLVSGRLDEAHRELTEAVRLAPARADAHNNLGAVALALGRPADARRHLERALELMPAYPEAHYNLGRVDLAEGRADAAATRFAEAIRLRHDYADAHVHLGGALERLDRWPEAAAAYEAATRWRPTAEVFDSLGLALIRGGRAAAALAPLNRAVQLDRRLASAPRHLGDALTDLGRLDDAVAAYQAALAVEPPPGMAETHNNLGIAFAMQGRRADAIAAFESALRVRPDFEDARRNLARAKR